MGAYLELWRRAFDFSGRTSRSRFWQAIGWECLLRLMFLLFVPLTVVLCTDLSAQQIASAIDLAGRVYGFCLLISLTSMTVRRLRDAGYSAKALFWLLVPGIGMLALICRLCEKSIPESNSDPEI